MKLVSFYQESLNLYISPRLTTLEYMLIVPIDDREMECAVHDKDLYTYITKASLRDCINRIPPFRLPTKHEKELIETAHLICKEEFNLMKENELIQISPESYSQVLLVKDRYV